MDINEIKELLITLLPIIGIAAFFFLYFKNEKVRSATQMVLKFGPFLLSMLASKIPDKKGVFDSHDLATLLGRLLVHIDETISDPSNSSFDEVQDDLFDFIRVELDGYRESGMTGVPNIEDEHIRTQIRIVFESFQRAFSEDSTGNNSTD